MFWKYNTSSSSQIDSLLAKEDVTLQEVMDSDDIISECRVQNKNLIDFLLRPEVIEELVTLTIKEPSVDLSEKTRFKYPNVASELLTCDVPAINERLAGDERLLEKLYIFLENEQPLNPLLASYFSKIMGALIAKKTEQVLDFLKARDTFLPLLIKHLGTSAIMDLMLKLMTQVEGVEMRQNILNWLDSQRIIQQLVSLLNPKIDKERHDNVAQLLCDFIRTARDKQINSTERADPDPLLNTLESSDTMCLLLDQIFDKEKCESSIVGGVQVFLGLLGVTQSSIPIFRSAASIAASIATSMYNSNINDEAMDMEQKQRIILTTTDAICTRIKDFHELLLNPPKQSPILTTIGQLDQPLGNTRLQVLRLFAAIISSNHEKLYDELIRLNTFSVMLDLFFKYTWNNFLHTQVEDCIVNALKACVGGETNDVTASALCKHLLDSCNLVERLLQAWKENDEQQATGKSIRKGFMGHLISMVNKIVDMSITTSLGQHLKNLKPETATSLEEFKETTLAEVISEQEILLGGAHPSTAIQNNDDFGDIPFPQSSAVQQQEMYSQYQMQNLATQYIDGYSGFNDDAFNDGDDTLQTIDNPSDVNFDLSESAMVQRDEIFKQVCAQSINTLFDADDQIFEDRDHTFQTVIEKQGDKIDAVYSSDSDDESPCGEENMDVDPWSSSKSDPWNTLASSTTDTATSAAWADFSTAAFVETRNFPAFDELKAKVNKECSTSIEEKKERKESQTNTIVTDSKPTEGTQKVGSTQIVVNTSVETATGTSVEKATGIEEKEEKAPQGEAEEVKSAASGDHINQQDDKKSGKAEGGSEQQPSMPIEGDTCKLPEKTQQTSPEKAKTDQAEKV